MPERPKKPLSVREARLARALKENLKRRKAQARARLQSRPDETHIPTAADANPPPRGPKGA